MRILQNGALRPSCAVTRVIHVVGQVDGLDGSGALTRCNHSLNLLDTSSLTRLGKNPVLASGEVRTLAVGIQHDVATSGSHAKPMKGTRALDPGCLQDPRCLNHRRSGGRMLAPTEMHRACRSQSTTLSEHYIRLPCS